MLGSRKPQERAAGVRALAQIIIYFNDVDISNNRKLVEFQEAVVTAGCIPLIVRALGAADTAADAVVVVNFLAAYSSASQTAFAAAGVIPPLIALLASPSIRVQENAAVALCSLSTNAENRVTIASAGGIPRLIALVTSQSVGVRDAASRALRNLGVSV